MNPSFKRKLLIWIGIWVIIDIALFAYFYFGSDKPYWLEPEDVPIAELNLPGRRPGNAVRRRRIVSSFCLLHSVFFISFYARQFGPFARQYILILCCSA